MIASIIKRLIPAGAKKMLRDKLGVPSQENSFINIERLGFKPQFCLDIGAYKGEWTREFKLIFPDCSIMMFEGQTQKESYLAAVEKDLNGINYTIALLGAAESKVEFNIYETASSVLTEHHDTNAKTETRKLLTLDGILGTLKLKSPDFIKIDTQGYELEILKGGEKALKGAEFVLLEVSFIDIYKNAPLANDVIDFMKVRGFVIYDICTLMKRPLDKALYQADVLFVRENSSFRKDKRWS